ncbi:MAG: hypothetical protein IJ809_02765 [Clostridia bacterium]|nr:hypothetical protein [Clostridia bacterium]
MKEKIDFQEFLNEEIVNARQEGKINKYYSALLEALEEKIGREKETTMLEQFEEAASSTDDVTSSNMVEEKIIDALDEKNVIDEEDELVVGNVEEKKEDVEEEKVEENVDIEISDEEVENAYPDSDLSKNAKRYALTYERVMEQYYKLKLDLEKQNVREGKYSYDDKHFYQLMQLKTVAIDYEVYFRNACSGKYVAVADAIAQVKEMQERNEIEIDKYQDENNRMHERQNEKVNSVASQIEECLEKIDDLNSELLNADVEEKKVIMYQISEVREMYIKLNKKLESIKPNPNELASQEMKSKEQNEIESKVNGVHYTKYVNRYGEESLVNNARYLRKEEERDAKENSLDKNGALDSISKAEEKLENAKEKEIDTIRAEVNKGNLDVAENLAEDYIDTYSKDFNKKDDSEVKEFEKVKEEIEQMKKEKDKVIDSNNFSDRTMHADELAMQDALDDEAIKEMEALARGEKPNFGKEKEETAIEENDLIS